ncbi:hypothetical protein BH11MYX1_BH11MYX1_04880 [soil metagenome]
MAAALAAGCGNVVKSERAVDASLSDALACTAPENACGGACVNITSSSENCGACGQSCTAGRETCTAGHCVDQFTSCANIHTVFPSAPSGFYTLIDSTVLYCDVPSGIAYQSLVMGAYATTPIGYTMISATDLQDSGKQGAFVALYNQQGGLTVPTAFTSSVCCFKNDATSASTMLFLRGSYLYPAAGGMSQCNQAGGYVVGTTYQLDILPDDFANHLFATAPLDAAFFTVNPATSGTSCGVGTNPSLFWKVIQ